MMNFTVMVINQRIGAPWLGFVIPAAIFLVSVALTFLLIRHFSKDKE